MSGFTSVLVIALTTTWSVVLESNTIVDSSIPLTIIHASPLVEYYFSDTVDISEVLSVTPLIILCDGIVLIIAIILRIFVLALL